MRGTCTKKIRRIADRELSDFCACADHRVVVKLLRSSLTGAVGVAAPEFQELEDGPHNINVTAGHSVSVHCRTHAEPPADVTWYQNGQPLNRTYPTVFCRSLNSPGAVLRGLGRPPKSLVALWSPNEVHHADILTEVYAIAPRGIVGACFSAQWYVRLCPSSASMALHCPLPVNRS